MLKASVLPKRGKAYITVEEENWDVPDKGRRIEGYVLLQTDLISAVRVKVQTPLFCVEVSGVLCWHFSLHINSVLSKLSTPHPPLQPTSIYHGPPSSSSIDRRQFVLVQHVFLSQIHTHKPTEIFAACALVCQKQSWRLFCLRYGKTYFRYRKLKNPILDRTSTPHFSLIYDQNNKNGIKMHTDLVGGTVGWSSGWKPGHLCKPGGSCPGTDWPVQHSPRGSLTDAPDLRHKAQPSACRKCCHADIIKLGYIF